MSTNDESILTTTKAALGLLEDYDAFDADVILHLNSVLSDLGDLGIGPDEGFEVTDATQTWADFVGQDLRLNKIKSYVHLRVKLLFDSPTIGFVIASMEKQIEKAEWRINITREERDHPAEDPDDELDEVEV